MITGGASGLGFAMACKCRALGMHVALADLREASLATAVQSLSSQTAPLESLQVRGFSCDVTAETSVRTLLSSVQAAFGADSPLRFVAANAGIIFTGATLLGGTAEQWEATYRVNVLGVANTLRVFVPALAAQECRSVVSVTASFAGVIFGGTGPYGTSKLAALGIAEALHGELAAAGLATKVRVVALCPALVATELSASTGQLTKGVRQAPPDAYGRQLAAFIEQGLKTGMSASFCAEELFRHIQEGKFYCMINNDFQRDGRSTDMDSRITDRFLAMLGRHPPLSRTSPVDSLAERLQARAKL